MGQFSKMSPLQSCDVYSLTLQTPQIFIQYAAFPHDFQKFPQKNIQRHNQTKNVEKFEKMAISSGGDVRIGKILHGLGSIGF